MYEKIHKRLTLVFTGISSLIFAALSAACLFLSEQTLLKNSFLSFSEEMNTIVSNLELQTVISHEWLAKISGNGRYLIAVYDNGLPLSYTENVLSDENLTLIDEILQDRADLIRSVPSPDFLTSVHKEFTYISERKDRYYVCFIQIRHSDLTAVILHPAKKISAQLLCSRIFFLALNLAGILLLYLFSWQYTRRLLSPIQRSQEGQTAFIAAASHELRTPLCVIQSCISAMEDAPQDQKNRFLSVIEAESRRMTRLVADLLTLTRADSHTWSFHLKETELDTILIDTCENFRPLAAEKQISLSIEFMEELFPPCLCDGERVSQVFGILISNAISYGHPGGYVKLSLAFQNGTFIFQAIDNGIGISKEEKEHIFERFYRADPSRSGKEHLGLGLCIAKEIVEAHHGSIEAEDAPGSGTVFTVRLPRLPGALKPVKRVILK